jgi:DNA-binding Lrp family transcriptional regulator
MKTIRQIADEIGVSKDKVRYQVRKLPSHCIDKVGNITYITDGGMAILQGLLLGKTVNFTQYASEEFTRLFPAGDTKRIIELESEVERLKWQLEFERATSEEKLALQKQRADEVAAQTQQALEDNRKWRMLVEREQQLRLADKAQTIKQLTEVGMNPDEPSMTRLSHLKAFIFGIKKDKEYKP